MLLDNTFDRIDLENYLEGFKRKIRGLHHGAILP